MKRVAPKPLAIGSKAFQSVRDFCWSDGLTLRCRNWIPTNPVEMRRVVLVWMAKVVAQRRTVHLDVSPPIRHIACR